MKPQPRPTRWSPGISTPATRPWLALYDPGLPSELELEYENLIELFAASVARAPDRALVQYFEATLTVGDVDRESDWFACALHELGVSQGDRVAVVLQNVPQFFVVALAVWKLGGALVPVNPMLRFDELRGLVADSGASVILALESYFDEVVASRRAELPVRCFITTAEDDYLAADRGRPAHSLRDEHDFRELVLSGRGKTPPLVSPAATDVAALVYTSGTTGRAKGAMVTHGNVVFNAQAYRDWLTLGPDDSVLGIAPLFHITGLVAHLAVALLVPMPCLLAGRFEPGATLDLIEQRRPTFTAASITAFIALMNHPTAGERSLSSLTKALSGGAPIPPSVVDAWEVLFGTPIRNLYGLTETTSPSHMVPMQRRSPVDPRTGALSVGVPIFNTVVTVVDEAGAPLEPGEIGELATSGPQVVPGYWQNPEETRNAFPGGVLRTGDLGYMNAEGWFFVIDRKKDLINTSGFKVWPREVEDVVYQHPSVREAAVVGVADSYRGEAVKAYVALAAGTSLAEADLIAFCKSRLAAYKCPRTVEFVDELPKTSSGKILRRELRDRG